MTAEIKKDGTLLIRPQNQTESFAIGIWIDRNALSKEGLDVVNKIKIVDNY